MKLYDMNIVLDFINSIIGKNIYTQEPDKRLLVDKGYGDCSSTVRHAYKLIGIDIGSFTGDQIKKGRMIDSGRVMNKNMNINNLKPGDLLFYKGYSKPSTLRPYGVGHVEIYLGDNKLAGHGEGKGPTIKICDKYMIDKYIMAKRIVESNYIKNDNSINLNTSYILKESMDLELIGKSKFWKDSFNSNINVFDTFSVLYTIYYKFKEPIDYNPSHENIMMYLYNHKLINDIEIWNKKIADNIQIWTIFYIMMRIYKNISINYKDIKSSGYKLYGIEFCDINGLLITDKYAYTKRLNDYIKTDEALMILNHFYKIMKR